MDHLYLVATAHTDPDGMARLSLLLNHIKPRRILLEISEDRAKEILSRSIDDKMLEHEKDLDNWARNGFILTPEQRAQILTLARFKNSNYGFELRGSLAYQQEFPECDVKYIDVCLPTERLSFIAGLREAVGMEQKLTPQMRQNILQGLQLPVELHIQAYREDIEGEYQQAPQKATMLEEMSRNEEFFERVARGLSNQAKESIRYVIDPKRNSDMAARIREYHTSGGTSVAVMGAAHAYLIAPLVKDLSPALFPLNMVSR